MRLGLCMWLGLCNVYAVGIVYAIGVVYAVGVVNAGWGCLCGCMLVCSDFYTFKTRLIQ